MRLEPRSRQPVFIQLMRKLACGQMDGSTSNIPYSILWDPLLCRLNYFCFYKLIAGANEATDSDGAVAGEVR